MSISFKKMCEHIANAKMFQDKLTGEFATPEEIFNYSSTGELFMILEWYIKACLILGKEAD